MLMATFPALCRYVLPYTSGLPGDVVVNDFAIQGNDVGEVPWDILEGFWNAEKPGQGSALHTHLSNLLDRGTDKARIELYVIDLATGKTGSPVEVQNFTLGAVGANTSGPPEVALCTSYASAVPGGVNAQRRKGRMFIGPFSNVQAGSKPTNNLRTDLAAATENLAADLAENGTPMCVWSRADEALFPVTRGWVDDAWDTQRRRGIAPTTRTAWNL